MNQYLKESSKTLTDLLAEEFMERGREEGIEKSIQWAIQFGLSKEDVITMFRITEETYQEVCEKGSGTV